MSIVSSLQSIISSLQSIISSLFFQTGGHE